MLAIKESDSEYHVKAEPVAISRLCPHCGELQRVQLVWSCEAADVPEMSGDEPWTKWGGNAIIEASGARQPDDSGSEGYTDKYGDEIVSQWVQWSFPDAEE